MAYLEASLESWPRLEGIVLKWNERGFGFIGLPDDRRAYVHSSQFGGGNLEVGETVSAVIIADPVNAGKWQAKDVRRSKVPEVKQEDLLEGTSDPNRLQAVIAEWHPRGYGFCLIPDGRRAYVHISQLVEGKCLSEGESVVATILEDKQNPGKWAAYDVKRVAGLRQSTCVDYLKGSCKWGEACRYAHSTKAERDAAAQLGEPVQREICVDFMKGECLRDNCRFLHAPRRVVRSPCIDFMKGNCTRSQCRYAHGEEEQTSSGTQQISPSDASLGHQASAWADSAGGLQAAGIGASATQLLKPRVEGTVVEWHERGFGFIDFKDGRRAYVHHSAFGGGDLQSGVTVNAVVNEDPDSKLKWRAEDVQLGRWPPMQTIEKRTSLQQVASQVASPQQTDPQQMVQMDAAAQMASAQMQIASQMQAAQMAQMGQMASMGMVAMQSPMGPMMMPVMMAAPVMMPMPMCQPIMQVQPMMQVQPVMQMQPMPAVGTMATQPSKEAQPRVEGVVVKWEERGYGFIEFGPNSQIPEKIRAYCHSSSFNGGDPAVGEVVNAILAEDEQNPGKWAAVDVQRGPLGEDGTLISWRPDKGFGFIAMDDGRRAYIHHTSFGGGNLEIGVRLRVVTKPDEVNQQKWSVAEVKCELSPEEESSQLPPDELAAGHAARSDQVPKDPCVDFLKGVCTRGDACRFAHSLAQGGTPAGLTRMCSAFLKGTCLADNCKYAHSTRANPACERIPEEEQRQEVTGTVSEWDTKGYGFILLEDNRRAYVHHTAFGSGNLEVGENVNCVVVPDRRNRGKFMVESLTRAAELTTQMVEDWTEGKVVEWDGIRRHGFIHLRDGRRLYVPTSVLFGGYLIKGEEIQAKPTEDKNQPGYWMAVSVRGEGVVGGGNEAHVKRPRLQY